MGVWTHEGQTALTRIPYGALSSAYRSCQPTEQHLVIGWSRLLTCILGYTHQGMLGGCVLHDPQRGNEGAAGRHVDDYSSAEVPRTRASAAVSRHLLLHDFADHLDKK